MRKMTIRITFDVTVMADEGIPLAEVCANLDVVNDGHDGFDVVAVREETSQVIDSK